MFLDQASGALQIVEDHFQLFDAVARELALGGLDQRRVQLADLLRFGRELDQYPAAVVIVPRPPNEARPLEAIDRMFCVFGSFVLGDERALKLFGMGLAVAVLVDATIVRLVLVPATMELLGDRNWWLPKWLDRLLPTVHVEPTSDLDRELGELTEQEQVRR